MSYDFEPGESRDPPKVSTPTPDPRDLEAIVTLLDLAAICLTPKPGTKFTIEELIAKAQEIGGDEIPLNPKDLLIVLPFMKYLKRRRDPGKTFYYLK